MATSPRPSTPTSTPQRAIPPTSNLTSAQRSFTFPARPSTATTTTPTKTAAPTTPKQPQQQDSSYEILFTHPNTQVIKFKAATPTPPPGSSNSKTPVPKIPWSSPSEVTSASGHLEIYRVPGSVSFVRSGSFLLQLLPRSQCWCVDGAGKFAFRAREMGTYYRVELPVETEEDREKVESLKAVLAGVIFYEKGGCPFERGDGAPAMEEAEEEVVVDVRRKKRRSAEGRAKAKRWHLDRAYGWKPEGWEPGMDEPEEEGRSGSASEGSPTGSEEDEEEEEDVAEPEEADTRAGAEAAPSARQKAIQALRSASAPHSQQPQVPHQPSRLKPRPQMDGATSESEASTGDTASSSTLRTFQPILTDMPPSPPDSSAGLDYSENRARFENAAVEAERTREPTGAPKQEESGFGEHEVAGEDRSVDDEGGQVEERVAKADILAEDEIVQDDGVRRDDRTPDDEHVEEFKPPESSGDVDVDALDDANEDSVEELDEREREVLDNFAKPGEEEEYDQSAGSTHEDARDEPVYLAEQAVEAPLIDEEEADTHQIESTRHAKFDDEHLEHTIEDSTRDPSQPLEQRTPTPSTPEPENSLEEESPLSQTNIPQTPELVPTKTRTASSEDPYAAIQARILARRSLSGTTSFHPLHKSPTRSSISSTSSSATMISNAASRTARSRHQQHGSEYSSLVTRFSSVFLGPPAHLVQIMLKIAARFANGAFGVNGMFYSESPIDSPRKVPGGYGAWRGGMDGVEEVDVAAEAEWASSEEDDFGVPLHRPASGLVGEGGGRERRGRSGDVD